MSSPYIVVTNVYISRVMTLIGNEISTVLPVLPVLSGSNFPYATEIVKKLNEEPRKS